MSAPASPLPRAYFTRYDESDDSNFYNAPRLTTHIDAGAVDAVGALYDEVLPANGVLLDLMSSWRSHLPPTLPYTRLIGLGLNAVELEENPQLDEYRLQDLNRLPALPFADAQFDGAICCVSVQYLTRPVEVFAEVGRVLKPDAPFVVSFSNRCFPSKAVRIWTTTDDQQHIQLVQLYFQYAGLFGRIAAFDRSPQAGWGDPLFAVVGWRSQENGETLDTRLPKHI